MVDRSSYSSWVASYWIWYNFALAIHVHENDSVVPSGSPMIKDQWLARWVFYKDVSPLTDLDCFAILCFADQHFGTT
jgi:hypothetical protein